MEILEEQKLKHKHQKSKPNKNKIIRWSPPPSGFIKVNFDGSIWSDGQATFGCVFRNPNGGVVHLAAESGQGSSPLLAEARAMRFACREAARLGFKSGVVEGDCLAVINAVLLFGQCP